MNEFIIRLYRLQIRGDGARTQFGYAEANNLVNSDTPKRTICNLTLKTKFNFLKLKHITCIFTIKYIHVML